MTIKLPFADRVQETTATTGTGTMTLAGASTQYQAFSGAFTTGDVVYYCILDGGGVAWEVGYGTYTTSGTTLTRNVLSSSTGSAISLTGTSTVFCTLPAAAIGPWGGTGNVAVSTTYSVGITDQTLFIAGGSAYNVTLPPPTANRSLAFTTDGAVTPAAAISFLQNGAEKLAGVAGSLVYSASWSGGVWRANGTDWYLT